MCRSPRGAALLDALLATALVAVLLLPVLTLTVTAEQLDRALSRRQEGLYGLRLAAGTLARDARFAASAAVVDADRGLLLTLPDGVEIGYELLPEGVLVRRVGADAAVLATGLVFAAGEPPTFTVSAEGLVTLRLRLQPVDSGDLFRTAVYLRQRP